MFHMHFKKDVYFIDGRGEGRCFIPVNQAKLMDKSVWVYILIDFLFALSIIDRDYWILPP